MGSLNTAREAVSQTNKRSVVKHCIAAAHFALVLASAGASLSPLAQAQSPDAPPPPPPTASPESESLPPPPPTEPSPEPGTVDASAGTAEALIQIEARSFAVTTLKRSKSLRVYQIEDKSGELPIEGKILLLRRGVIPVMGLKVIKLYPETRSFAAKRMQIYDNRRALDLDENYEALEKTGETVITPPSPQDQADLKEIESGPPLPPPPPEAPPGEVTDGMPIDPPPPPPGDTGDQDIPPPPDGEIPAPPESESPTQDELPLESHNSLVVEETKPLDPHHHWISATGGTIANFNADGNLAYYAAVGARYGLTLAKALFLNGLRVQDSLVAEVGASLYQISGYQEAVGDSYTIMPLVGTLRYNFQITETFGLFLYGGVVKNFITASANADIVGTSYLGGLMPAFGGGAYLTMGPSWNLRADAGYDTFAVGLMLRF